MKFSVIIPARNEEKYIDACIQSVMKATKSYHEKFEIIVVLNRCTDNTEMIARMYGARIIKDNSKTLSDIRNTGVKAAKGEIIVTLDADSIMSSNLLSEIDLAISSGKYIGGGVWFKLERLSLGIILTFLMFIPLILWYRVFGGSFWFYRKDFEAIGGFDENRLSFEDIDFAKRLKAYGRTKGKRFKILHKAYIRTSCRKFDKLGDWYLVRRPFLVLSLLRGTNRKAADYLWYDSEDR